MRLLTLLPLIMTLTVPAMVAAPPEESRPGADHAVNAETMAGGVLRLTDLIMEHHVDPPTRQEMILGALRSLCDVAELDQPFDLSRRVSSLTEAEGFRLLLQEFLERAMASDTAGMERIRGALTDGVLGSVPGEPRIIGANELKVEEQLAANRYVGTGIVLAMQDGPRAVKVFRRGPGHRAGLKDGDRILRIDDATTEGMNLRDIVERLRGQEGVDVALVVQQPDQEAREVTVTRGVVPRVTVRGYRDLGDEEWSYDVSASVGYVALSEIGASTVHELRQTERLMQVKGLRALVVDLRSLRGASHDIHPAVLMANSLLDGGEIGRLRARTGVREFKASPECLFRDWPVAVLVSRETSAEGKFVAAALQDNERALLFGGELKPYRIHETRVPLPDGGGAVTLATGVLERPRVGESGDERRGFRLGSERIRRVQRGVGPPPRAWEAQPERAADRPDRTRNDQLLDEAVTALEKALQ